MIIFKVAYILLPATFLLTLCSLLSNITELFDTIIFLCISSGALTGKIIYDRYKNIQCISTSQHTTAAFANKISAVSSMFLFSSFLLYLVLVIIKVDKSCLTALNLFACGFGTLYIWMQSIITNDVSSIYYNKNLLSLRRLIASASLFVLIATAVFGTASVFFPANGIGAKTGNNICIFVTTLCSYIAVALFSILLLSFEIDTDYFKGLESTRALLDDACTFDNSMATETESLHSQPCSALIIRGCISSMRIS